MEQLKEQFEEFVVNWKDVYNTCSNSPSLYTPYLTQISLDEVNTMIMSLRFWLERSKAPKGYSREFNIVRGLLNTSIKNMIQTAKLLRANQYNHFQSLLSQLVQIYSSLHTMIVLYRDDAPEIIANLSADLASAYTLVTETISTLEQKLELCEKAEEWSNKAEESVSLIDANKKKTDELLSGCEYTLTEAQSVFNDIKETNVEIDKAYEHTTELLETNNQLHEKLEQQQADLRDVLLLAKSNKQPSMAYCLLLQVRVSQLRFILGLKGLIMQKYSGGLLFSQVSYLYTALLNNYLLLLMGVGNRWEWLY